MVGFEKHEQVTKDHIYSSLDLSNVQKNVPNQVYFFVNDNPYNLMISFGITELNIKLKKKKKIAALQLCLNIISALKGNWWRVFPM